MRLYLGGYCKGVAMNQNLRDWLEDSGIDARTKEAIDRMSPEEGKMPFIKN